jgi:hypothetical protein
MEFERHADRIRERLFSEVELMIRTYQYLGYEEAAVRKKKGEVIEERANGSGTEATRPNVGVQSD